MTDTIFTSKKNGLPSIGEIAEFWLTRTFRAAQFEVVIKSSALAEVKPRIGCLGSRRDLPNTSDGLP
jgi:hypothetical protein